MNKYRLREILVYAYIMQVYTMSELRHSKPLTLVAQPCITKISQIPQGLYSLLNSCKQDSIN